VSTENAETVSAFLVAVLDLYSRLNLAPYQPKRSTDVFPYSHALGNANGKSALHYQLSYYGSWCSPGSTGTISKSTPLRRQLARKALRFFATLSWNSRSASLLNPKSSKSLGKRTRRTRSAAKSDAQGPLAQLLEAWRQLSPAERRQFIEMVQGSLQGEL